jgi:hypothetical protein
MTIARRSLEHRTSAAGGDEQAARHRHRASKLFEADHAYAARLVQIATAIPGERSITTMKSQNGERSEVGGNDRITDGIATQAGARQSGP